MTMYVPDLPYLYPVALGLAATTIFFNVVFVIYYVKARHYKELLDEYKKKCLNSTTSPTTSETEAATRSTQFKGKTM